MISGFFPIHAAVAASSIEMVKFLISLDGLDRQTRNNKSADLGLTTVKRTEESQELTPLQFAFSLGDAAMTEFLIHERAIVQWQWGPLVSLAIPLYEIDSAGPSPNDMMQACLP